MRGILFLFLSAITLWGCGGGASYGMSRASSAPMTMNERSSGMEAPPSPGATQALSPTGPSNLSAAIKPADPEARRPLLIYTATLSLAVFEARKSADAVEALANEMGGYLVKRTGDVIVVRVPAASFDKALLAVSKMGDELHREVKAQDITAQFRDLQIRLKNLEAVLVRLQLLLTRADTVKDALKVEKELERVAGQIEQIKGQLKLYSELLAFSTITVKFQAQPTEKIESEVSLPFPWLDELGLSQLLELGAW